MTTDEAKFILSAFRPSGRDTDNPPFADALRMAGSDPQLGRWLEKSRAYDAAVGAKLSQVNPPVHLRQAILAGARVSARPRGLILRYAWAAGLAAAAALVFAVLTMKGPVRDDAAMTAMAGFAIDDTLTQPAHITHGEPAAAIKASLQVEGAPMPTEAQVDFDRLRDTGCRTLRFAGHDVVEVCFARNGSEFHLYMARRHALAGANEVRVPAFIEKAGAAAVAWSDRSYDYVVVGTTGVEALRKLL